MDETEAPVLLLRSTRALRRHGIIGKTSLIFDEGHLVFTGSKRGQLLVAPSGIVRLRSGIDRLARNGPWFETSVWLYAAPQRLRFTSNRFDMDAYAAVFGGLAKAMADEGLMDRIETGAGRRELLLIAPLLLLFLSAIWVGLVALPGEAWYLRLLPAVAPAILGGLLLVLARRTWPRPVKALSEYLALLDYPQPRIKLRLGRLGRKRAKPSSVR